MVTIVPKIGFNNIVFSGLKITAIHQTMSSQNENLSEQNLGLAVILTGPVCCCLLYFWKI